MPHIHTEPNQHDVTASAYIVRTDSSEPRIMLPHHRILGKMMQFEGHVELDEHPWQTVAREIREETGYDFGQLAVLLPPHRLSHLPKPVSLLPPPLYMLDTLFGGPSSQHYHDDIAWAFVAQASPKYSLAADESEEIVLYTKSELIALANDKILEDVRQTALFVFEHCLSEWEAVSAKTAAD